MLRKKLLPVILTLGLIMGMGSTLWAQDDSVVLYFNLDEGEGKEVQDASGNNNGELVGNPQWVDGKYGKALLLNGSSDYVKIPDSPSLHIKDKITVMAWVKPENVSHWGGIVAKSDDAANHADYTLWISSGKIQFTFNWPEEGVGAGGPNVGKTVVKANEWSHFAGVWDGSKIKLYVNGEVDGEFDRTTPIKDTTANLYIGVEPGGGDEYFGGAVDEVAVIHDAWEKEEIKKAMEGLKEVILDVQAKDKLSIFWGRIKREIHLMDTSVSYTQLIFPAMLPLMPFAMNLPGEGTSR